jgi:hypothetical protein
MGIFSGLRLARNVAGAATSGAHVDFPVATVGGSGIVSPWGGDAGELGKIIHAEALGLTTFPVTREEAMTLPSVVAARGLILSELAGAPLRALNSAGLMPKQPAWLYRTDTAVPPWFRLAHTFDDWLFHGQTLWAVERGTEGQILDAIRIPYDRWTVNASYEIIVDDKPAPAGSVLYMQGPFEGLLNVASRSIRAALDLERSWAGKARNPIPAIVLREKEDNGMSQKEATKYVEAVSKARMDPNGAVMFIPYGIEVSFEGDVSNDLLIEARNAVKLDIANFCMVPSGEVDAALPKASLNYETQDGNAQKLAARMSYWTGPLEARLSMDDVCPRGQRIRFDLSGDPAAARLDTGPYQED